MPGLSSLSKEAAGDIISSGVKDSVLSGVAIAAALKGISAATDYFHEKTDKHKFNNVINYAKNKHPELRDVPHEKLMHQMNAFYTLSPKIAVNKELGASMLVTTNDYGGNIDLATAKLISEIGEKASKQKKNKEEILSFVSTGSSLAGKKK